jgi:branched-chain amino acid transport system ATP-binding protein
MTALSGQASGDGDAGTEAASTTQPAPGTAPLADPARNAALAVVGVGKRFGGVRALNDVSLSVAPGEVCGLIGPNGAGKTTLFDVISGVTSPSAGRVLLRDKDITGRTPTWRARHGIRRTFQKQQPFAHLTVEDNLLVATEWRGGGGGILGDLVRLPTRTREEKKRRERTADALEAFGLSGLRRERAGRLTIGQIRLVEMARAMVDQPHVLLLDEPTSGLAEQEVVHLARALEQIRADRTCAVLLVEHDMSFVMRECGRVVVLNLGEVLAAGTPDEIRQHPAVTAAYLGTSV